SLLLRSFFLILFFFQSHLSPLHLHSFPTRRSSDLTSPAFLMISWAFSLSSLNSGKASFIASFRFAVISPKRNEAMKEAFPLFKRSEEHTSELQSLTNLVCRLLLEKKKTNIQQLATC